MFIDGQWQDITPYVMTRDGTQNVSITRGQPDESTKANPGRAQFQLNNRDGRFSPRNPLSPLYGKINRNQQLRVSVPNGNVKAYRFWGEVSSWPQNWDTTGTDVWVEMDASGVLRRLGQGSRGIGSAMYVSLASAVPDNTVVAYWPCEDPSAATSIGSAVSGVPPMTITGAPTLATNSDFVCSLSLPTLGTTGRFFANIPDYTAKVPGAGGPSNTLNSFHTLIRFLLEVPQAGITDGTVLVSWKWTGSIPNWEVYYAAAGGGQIGLRGKDTLGNVVQDTGVGGPALNGVKVHVTASLDISGGILFEFGLSILTVGSASPSGPSGSAFGPVCGIVQTVRVAPNANLGSTVVGHVSVQLTPDTPTDGTDLANVLQAYAGETAAARISRLCTLAGIAFELIGSASDTMAMGTQLNSTILDLIQQCVDADLGRLFETVDALGLGYRTRVDLENQAAALALSYTAFNLADVPVPVDDDRYTRNDVTVSRTGGSSARQTLSTGTLSTLAPPNGVGPYDESQTVNIQTDARLNDVAGWLLHLGTVDDPRYPKVAVNLAHASFTSSTTLKAQVLTLRPGDRYTVSGLPSWVGPDGLSQLLLSTTETIDLFQHRITLNGQPESPYRTARLADSTYGRIDTGGSQLAADAGPADTTLSVATTSGPVWTTSAGDFPFDVRLGGEQVTVTNITGATSPQTFTVTRSVNGVVKPQAAGTDVRLNQPMILGL